MPRVSLRHATVYRYRTLVAFGEHRLMARPAETHDQRLLAFEVDIDPGPASLRWIEDAGGAQVAAARFHGRADELAFEARAIVDHRPTPAAHLHDDDAMIGAGPFAYWSGEAAQLAPFLAPAYEDPAGDLAAFARRFVRPVGKTHLATVLADMTHAIRREFAYGLRIAGPPQSPLETLERRTGSCRDFAVLMIEAARSLGLAAQFVSGYVYSGRPTVHRDGGGHTHAWARVHLPEVGWFDFDPTNGIIGSTDLIRVAAVADPRQATPLHGTWSGPRSAYLGMEVTVEVRLEAPAQPKAALRVAAGDQS
jgi:transglutaminase-like putative cysteine protease